MLKITIDPLVLEKLKQSFPKPANRAQRALDKYVKLFEELLNKAEQFGRSKYESAFNLYSLNLRVLSQKGPQIGENSQRLHAWLAENNLQFYSMVERGSNFTGLVSQVKLSPLVHMVRVFDLIGEQINAATTDEQIDQALDLDPIRCKEIFLRLYPDYYCYQSQEHRNLVYERVPVDVNSLRAYVVWLNRNANKLNQHSIYERTKIALEILSVAKLTEGYYLQKIKLSEFGRIYYSGTSVQSISKDLRAAMLGNSWELDLRSSVIAFKLGFAQAFTQEKFPGISHRLLFSSSLAYVQERDLFLNSLRHHVFSDDKEISVELQVKLIKEALTAISFGARANSIGWRLGNGTWKNPALKEIFKNSQWHENFLKHHDVCSFIAEQEMLDNYFYEKVKERMPELLELEVLKAGKKLGKSKLISYIYQHQETEMMNFVRAQLRLIGKPAVASIHDAVIVKQELVNGQLADLNLALRKEFGNELLLLRQKSISGFKRCSIEPEPDFPMPTVEELLKRLGYSSLDQVSNQFNGVEHV